MLIGESSRREITNLLNYTKVEIELLKQQDWQCPSCRQPLLIKNGTVNRSHFAHRSKAACDAFSENETEEHLMGKELLANWCQNSETPYQLEAYLPELKQRPDILINGQIAIEFQCSSLSLERFCERTHQYQQHGYTVIWLLGKRFFLQERLSSFQRHCLYHHSNVGFYLWELDVANNDLRCQLHIEETLDSQQLFFETKRLSINQGKVTQSLAFPAQGKLFVRRTYESGQLLLEHWQKYERDLIRREARTLKLQEQLYQHGTHLRELSPVYFLPITQPLIAKDSAVMWRLLCWKCLANHPKQSLAALEQRLRSELKQGEIKVYQLPLINHGVFLSLFICQYVSLLRSFQLIRLENSLISVVSLPKTYRNSEIREQTMRANLETYKHISATPQQDMLL